MSIIKDLHRLYLDKVFTPPDWLLPNLQFLCLSGSESYGCRTDLSDVDITGIVIPPKQYIVPQEYGFIYGFDTFPEFKSYEKHHIKDKDKDQELDLTVFNIVNAFRLMANNNPNWIDILFVPRRCVVYSTEIWEKVIQQKKIFLSQEAVNKYRAYSFSQMKKLDRVPIGKRKEGFDKHNFDLKFAYNLVRLNLSAEQILQGDLDIERDREVFKSIRRGEWTLDQVKEWFFSQSKKLDRLQEKCTLPLKTDKEKIKNLLKECLNLQYQNMLEIDHSETIRKIERIGDDTLMEKFLNRILCLINIHNWIKQTDYQRCCNKCWKVQQIIFKDGVPEWRELMKLSDIKNPCPHCGKIQLVIVPAHLFYSEYIACEYCDSTYYIEEE